MRRSQTWTCLRPYLICRKIKIRSKKKVGLRITKRRKAKSARRSRNRGALTGAFERVKVRKSIEMTKKEPQIADKHLCALRLQGLRPYSSPRSAPLRSSLRSATLRSVRQTRPLPHNNTLCKAAPADGKRWPALLYITRPIMRRYIVRD